MQPAALSVEPLILFSLVVFLFGILPLANWIALKWRPNFRAIAVTGGLIVLVFASFNLGRMTGLSMAWYHWKREYKEPLWEWQLHLDDMVKAGNTNGIIKTLQRFSKEDVNGYGREKLFSRGKFREYVEAETGVR